MKIFLIMSLFVGSSALAISGGSQGGGGVGPRPVELVAMRVGDSWNSTALMADPQSQWVSSLPWQGRLVPVPSAFEDIKNSDPTALPEIRLDLIQGLELVKALSVDEGATIYIAHKQLGDWQVSSVSPVNLDDLWVQDKGHSDAVLMSLETGRWILINRSSGRGAPATIPPQWK